MVVRFEMRSCASAMGASGNPARRVICRMVHLFHPVSGDMLDRICLSSQAIRLATLW
jgi:hypothetical protein